MKRLLSILGSFMVTTTATTTVVACVRKNSDKNPDTPAQSELVAIDEAFTNKDFGYPSVAINTTNSTNATIVQSGLLYGLYATNPKLKTVVAEYNAKITWERGVTLTKSGDGTMISVTFTIDTTRGPETKTYDRVVVRYGTIKARDAQYKFAIVLSNTGKLLKTISKFRPNVSILALTACNTDYHPYGCWHSIFPILVDNVNDFKTNFKKVSQLAIKNGIPVGSKILFVYRESVHILEIQTDKG